MTTLRVVAISGSASRPSRTRALVELIGAQAARHRALSLETYDLRDAGPGLGAFSRSELSPSAAAVVEAIEGADALIVGSPVYKGSYTGLFKHLFDFVDATALIGRAVVLAATGGGRRHALVAEHQLRPLFGFFSALTLPTSVYASDEDFVDGKLADPTTLARVEQAAQELAALADIRSSRRPLARVA